MARTENFTFKSSWDLLFWIITVIASGFFVEISERRWFQQLDDKLDNFWHFNSVPNQYWQSLTLCRSYKYTFVMESLHTFIKIGWTLYVNLSNLFLPFMSWIQIRGKLNFFCWCVSMICITENIWATRKCILIFQDTKTKFKKTLWEINTCLIKCSIYLISKFKEAEGLGLLCSDQHSYLECKAVLCALKEVPNLT